MKRWLKNAKAAELLGVSVRTIKHWMNSPRLREALLAVRHGKQWKIPRPDYETTWVWETQRRLKEAGIHLKPSWEQELERVSKECDRFLSESYCLWLAAHLQLLEREGITDEDTGNILSLWQTANELLKSLPKGTEVDQLKSQFPESLRARNFSEESIRSIMSYWPDELYFKKVRAARTWKELEKIRRGMDFALAAKICAQRGKKPTATHLRPLVHDDWVAHINDTRQELPPNTIKAHKLEDIRNAAETDFLIRRGSTNPMRITEGRDAHPRRPPMPRTAESGSVSLDWAVVRRRVHCPPTRTQPGWRA
jgi:hypothetical protein